MSSHRRPIDLVFAAFLLTAAPALAQGDPQDPAAAARAKREALERALAEIDAQSPPAGSGVATSLGGQNPALTIPPLRSSLAQSGPFRLYDLSFDLLTAVGSSTERDASLRNLQFGDHDPRQRGFTVQNAELALLGAIDPYFRAETNIVFFLDEEGETIVELEEAFLTTTSLPHGFELEVGQMFTEFGRINPNHPHTWAFQDQPIVNSRFFGADGMRAPGARLGWLTPLPWFAEVHVGVQNANGETVRSFLANDEVFEEAPVGGRAFADREFRSFEDLVWLVRVLQSWQLDRNTTLALGASALFGPNNSGVSTRTEIYGADLTLVWNDGNGGRQAKEFVWQSEFLMRDYDGGGFLDPGDPGNGIPAFAVPEQSLQDWGLYTQALYRFRPNWRAGLRFEAASGRGDSFDGDARALTRSTDPLRDDRMRISPLLQWQATEYSRVRLQYNYDHADHLDDSEAHSVWLGFEISLGAHAAHKF